MCVCVRACVCVCVDFVPFFKARVIIVLPSLPEGTCRSNTEYFHGVEKRF